jgi:hypothetical protein
MSKRKKIPAKMRFEVLKRDMFRCVYCGAEPARELLELDHVHPVVKGGRNTIENLVTSCQRCNAGKRDRLLSSRDGEFPPGDLGCQLCFGSGYAYRFSGGHTSEKRTCPCLRGDQMRATLVEHGLIQ